jgi:hypothetical protein
MALIWAATAKAKRYMLIVRYFALQYQITAGDDPVIV